MDEKTYRGGLPKERLAVFEKEDSTYWNTHQAWSFAAFQKSVLALDT